MENHPGHSSAFVIPSSQRAPLMAISESHINNGGSHFKMNNVIIYNSQGSATADFYSQDNDHQ